MVASIYNESPRTAMKALLEAGVHFGHQTKRWNPKMSNYIFTERNGIHIIDLNQTVTLLNDAHQFVTDVTASRWSRSSSSAPRSRPRKSSRARQRAPVSSMSTGAGSAAP